MFAALFAQWRYVLAGLLVAGLVIFGMKVDSWRNDAAKLRDAQVALRAAIQQQIEADAARATAEKKLADAHGKIETQIKEVVKRVKVVVHDRSDCDLPADAVRLINEARSTTKPEPPP